MERTCGKCAYKALQGGKCPVFSREMKNDDVGCPVFSTRVNSCAICGNIMFYSWVIDQDDEGNYHKVCRDCASWFDDCRTCVNNKPCKFNDDKTCLEPPYVMVQKRQGNMVMQTQQLNPKRVMATCAQGCPCFVEEGLDDGTFCHKNQGCGCKNYKTNWRK